MNLSAFFASKLLGPIALAVAILSLGGNVWLGILNWSSGRTITTLTAENTRLAGDLRTCHSNNTVLESAMTVQGAAVDGLKSAADLSAANAKAGQAAAEAGAAAYDRAATALGKLPGLKPGADHCAAASQLIRDTLAGERTDGI